MYPEDAEGWRQPTLAETCMILKLGSLFSCGKPQGTQIIPIAVESFQDLGIDTDHVNGVVYGIVFVRSTASPVVFDELLKAIRNEKVVHDVKAPNPPLPPVPKISPED